MAIKTAGDPDWVFNGERWPNEERAKQAGSALAWRWTAVRAWKVFPSDDPPNQQ